MAATSFNVRFVNLDGVEESITVNQGDCVKKLVDTAKYVALLGGEPVGGDVQLRSGDVLEVSRKVNKAG